MPRHEIPHLRHPFQRGRDGKVITAEQDSPEHITSCELAIISCPVGYREERPEFGWPFPTFRTAPLSTDELTTALREFEPRSLATGSEYADLASQAIRHMQIELPVDSEPSGEPDPLGFGPPPDFDVEIQP